MNKRSKRLFVSSLLIAGYTLILISITYLSYIKGSAYGWLVLFVTLAITAELVMIRNALVFGTRMSILCLGQHTPFFIGLPLYKALPTYDHRCQYRGTGTCGRPNNGCPGWLSVVIKPKYLCKPRIDDDETHTFDCQ